MATNKHAIIRYQTLDKCFRNPGRKYYLEDLIECSNASIYEFTGIEGGIQKRQIFDDIRFMESPQGWNIPLEHIRDGHKVFYRYSDLSFSINSQPLNEMEEKQLSEALLTLSRFKGMPQFEWVDEIIARLDSGLGLSQNSNKIIEFDQNRYLKGLEFITPLYNAILYQKALDVEYKSFKKDEVQSFTFHPYFLKQFNNRWYAFGKRFMNSNIMNLALDRISRTVESKTQYIPNDLIDFNEYFEDIIGVTIEDERIIERITIKVKNTLYPYIQTKPIHGSQKQKELGPGYTIITLDLIPNYELESLLLSYGEGVEVISPRSLREKIRDRAKSIVLNYKRDSAD